jgi:1-deoxy-D-xylulose-5-phosphate reductoisomerase
MFKKKRIAVLGATGSIGKSALDIISQDKEDRFEVVLLAAHSSHDKINELSKQYPKAICVHKNSKHNLLSVIADVKPDITINGISGAAGLQPSVAAINAGSDLALANKETVVMAGELVMRMAKEKNVNIIPVDSEHSAIFHLLQFFTANQNSAHEQHEKVSQIILTASGGPFRSMSLQDMENITVQDALAHPTWNMGSKITIDSASMSNKGLEIIEACVFFNMPSSKIKVVIHPQSIVHSMIRLCNGVVYAQLSKPDMRHPIHDALYWPATTASSLDLLSFESLTLEFFKPDTNKFPMLAFAREAAIKGSLYPCAYNAANEIAVAAFMEQKIKFLDIPKITEHVLETDWTGNSNDLNPILEADAKARSIASSLISSLK